MPGVFNRRQRRGIQQPTSTSEVQVRTAQELRAAIAAIAARGSSDELAKGAGVVRVCAPLALDGPIVIPATCTGLTVCSSGKVPISAVGVVATLFEIRASSVSIRDIQCISSSTSNMFTAFVTMGTDALAPDADHPSLIDNQVGADRLYIEPAGTTITSALLRGNRQVEASASHSASIEMYGTNGRISDNVLSDGGGDTITLGAGAGDTTIVGNDLGGGDITTTASNGGNTVGINTNAGTITLHASDVEVGNPGASAGHLFIRTQIITSGTTITSHASATVWRVRMVGGGGASGKGDSIPAGGGGAGAYAEKQFTVAPSTGYTNAIGAAGAGGAGVGGNGGSTTLTVGATTVTCPGGTGGAAGAAAGPASNAGGAGGTIATNGDINMGGQPGGDSAADASAIGVRGLGGSGPFGSAVQAAAAIGFGAGGSGATSGNGKNGSAGLIVVEEYT